MIRDIALTLVTRVVVIGTGLVTSIVTARSLGADGLGSYFFVITLANLAAQLGNLGMVPANTFYLAADKTLLPQIVGNSLWASALSGTAISIVLISIYHDVETSASTGRQLFLLLIIVPTTLSTLLVSNIFVGLSMYRQFNYFTLGSNVFRVASVVFAAAMAFSVDGFLATAAVVGSSMSILLIWMLSRVTTLEWRFDIGLLWRQVGYAGRSYLAALFAFGVSRAGVIILETFTESAELGVFSVAQQFADVLVLLPATVALIFFPELLKGNESSRYSRTVDVAKKVSAAMFLICLLSAVIVPYAIPILFGREFESASIIFWCMLPGVFLLSITSILSQYLAASGVPLQNIYVWVTGLVVLVAVALALVPTLRGVGLAIALSTAYAFVTVWITFLAFNMSRSIDGASEKGAA